MSILLIGDSILQAMSLSLPSSFSAVFPRAEVHVESKTGASTRWWYTQEKLRWIVGARRPGVVVVELGTNDEGEENHEADYGEIIGLAARDARLYGARLLWIGPFAPDSGSRARWEIIRRTVGSADSIDGLQLAQGLPPVGIHFREASYPELSRRLARAVAERTGVLSAADGATMGVVTALGVGALVALLIAVVAGVGR